jgi:hypothetical protein
MKTYIRRLAAACMLGVLTPFAYADTCACDSPCSGSISCPGGCYAYCEENPENSGRHVCIKGCSSEDTQGNSGGAAVQGNAVAVVDGDKAAADNRCE